MVKLEYGSADVLLPASASKTAKAGAKTFARCFRLLESMGHGALTEFPLKNGRRADILSLGEKGELWIVEVKSGVPDFRADHKWQDYLEWCDRFFFAVGPEFPAGSCPKKPVSLFRTSTKPFWSASPLPRRCLARAAERLPCASPVWLRAASQAGTIPSPASAAPSKVCGR